MYGMHSTEGYLRYRKLALAIIAVGIIMATAAIVHFTDNADADLTQVDTDTYYYDLLTDSQKEIYDEIGSLTNKNNSFSKSLTTEKNISGSEDLSSSTVYIKFQNDLKQAFSAFEYDHPEKFWIGKGYGMKASYLPGNNTVTVTVTIAITSIANTTDYNIDTIQKSINTEVNLLKPRIDTASHYSIIISINSELINLLSYDTVAADTDYGDNSSKSATPRNIATAFITKNVVCEGYSKAFKYLCDMYGVPCIIVVGEGLGNNNYEPHMWNLVRLENGKWYIVDVTWNDSTNMPNSYLLRGSDSVVMKSKKISEDHIANNDFILPEMSTKDFLNEDYFVRFYNYDKEIISEKIYKYDQNLPPEDIPAVPEYVNDKIGTFSDGKWNISIPETVTSNLHIHPEYHIDYVNYVYRFYDEDESTVLYEDTYHYGDVIKTYPAPTKKSTYWNEYEFAGWVPELTEYVNGNQLITTYIASYDEIPIYHKVIFRYSDYFGKKIYVENSMQYGETIIIPADPSPEEDDFYKFKFVEWSPAVQETVGTTDLEYIAVFDYIINYKTTDDGDGVVVNSKYNSLNLENDVITAIKENGQAFKVNLLNYGIAFDVEATSTLSGGEELKVETRNFSVLTKPVKELIENALVYEFTFGNNVDFGSGTATISMPFDLRKGQTPENVNVYYVNGEEATLVPSTYMDGTITFETTHFSMYAIQIPVEEDEDDGIITLLRENYIIIIILLLAIIGIAISYKLG